jgi:hypothetical protein
MKQCNGFSRGIRYLMTQIIFLSIFQSALVYPQDTSSTSGDAKDNQAYKIEKPGTITFTVGVKIKGKVEKPQVMIFLPKEKPVYKEHTLDRSFASELAQPLDFSPIIE